MLSFSPLDTSTMSLSQFTQFMDCHIIDNKTLLFMSLMERTLIASQTVSLCCFPNNKLWVPKDIKNFLNEKKKVLRLGTKGICLKLKKGRDRCRSKIEQKLHH